LSDTAAVAGWFQHADKLAALGVPREEIAALLAVTERAVRGYLAPRGR
jgi:predicted transcriptional regulator